jgi:hypothetical protein
VPLPEMSRRSFLKLLGATLVAISLPIASTDLLSTDLALPAISARPADLSLQALPASATRLLQLAFDELRALGFPFLIDQGNVFQHPQRSSLFGLLLQDTLLAPRHQGADIAFTLDTDAPERSFLSFIVGRSGEQGNLHLAMTMLTTEGRRYQSTMVAPRASSPTTRGPVRSPLRHALTSNSWAPAAEAGNAEPVLTEHTNWYYGHCADPVWSEAQGPDGRREPRLRLASCQEFRNTRPVTAAQARFDGWQSEIRTIALRPASWTYSSRIASGKPDQGSKESV